MSFKLKLLIIRYIILFIASYTSQAFSEDPLKCTAIGLPCLCSVDETNGTYIDCNGITFQGDFPVLPHRSKVVSFSQSGSGLQSLESQLFTASDIPLESVDFSDNLLRRITERTFDGMEDTLREINFSDNKLGEQISALFSSGEFHKLKVLEKLDLSGNGIKDFQDGVFKDLRNLKELRLDRNFIVAIPRSTLQNLYSLSTLHLQDNHILDIGFHSFPMLKNLTFLNLSSNDIRTIQSSAFTQLPALKTLILSNNQIDILNSEFLMGLNDLTHLDLSQNILEEFSLDLHSIQSLKSLILHSNKIRSLNRIPLDKLHSLEFLDLRRNRIFDIPPNKFSVLKNLKSLHLDVNVIRKINNEMFSGLNGLSDLTLNDNRILAFPTEPLSALSNLKKLNMDYNRIAAISREILLPINKNKELSLAFNLISDISDGTFLEFHSLELLNLHGNKISKITHRKVEGLEDSLLYLDIGFNELTELPRVNFSNLLILSVAKNKISQINKDNVLYLQKILHLNISYNMLSSLTADLFKDMKTMQNLDLQHNSISRIPSSTFKNLALIDLNLKNNHLREIEISTFEDLLSLEKLDLSSNKIERISSNSFINLPNLKSINLGDNALPVFKGDEILGETNVKTLLLNHNKINYLYPQTFRSYPKIEHLDLSFNVIKFIPKETLSHLQFLIQLNLAGNKFNTIGDGYFANMQNLKRVDLRNNEISTISDLAFRNSSRLRQISLQNNKISIINENTFIGLNRLDLDISNNNISQLSTNVFSRAQGLKLEKINIANNHFREFPNEALKKQYSFLELVNISSNQIRNLPPNADVLVNVKTLDLSYNPLTPDAHFTLFDEPKSVRNLYVQGIGLSNLPTIECPFLKHLNLKGNKLTQINTNVFTRSYLLLNLDVSDNLFRDISSQIQPAWKKLAYLRTLDLSGNPIRQISNDDFDQLPYLKNVRISNLKELQEIKCRAFRNLPRLQKLEMHSYPNLQHINVKECIQNLTGLSLLKIETKDMYLKDQLQHIFSPKLDTLSVHGKNLRSVFSSAFAGMLSPTIKIELTDTSVDSFTDKIFLPLPLSSRIEFNIPHNRIETLTPEIISVLDNKQLDLLVHGMDLNPITCDCHMHFLWNWLREKSNSSANRQQGHRMLQKLTCYKPAFLKNKTVESLSINELVCDNSRIETTTTTHASSPIITKPSNTEYPFIIFEATKKTPSIPASDSRSTLTKVDTMIIGIVAGVVAFVCILIVIICIIRLRRAHPLYTAGPLAGPLAFRAQGKCTCLKPPPNNCTCYPMYPRPYSGRPPVLPGKMLASSADYLSVPGHLRNTPYYVTYPESENGKK